MMDSHLNFTYIGGPTVLLEISGLRLLSDPTFDAAGTDYPTSAYTLKKLIGPAMSVESLGRIDAVLLSHDHHFDNLDHAGRALLQNARKIITTQAGAERLGKNAVGLANWQSFELPNPNGCSIRVTGAPARHGPVNGDRGPVTGFVLTSPESLPGALYLSGDTVWNEGLADVGRRFDIRIALLFLGAARVPEVSPAHLTLTAEEAVRAAHAFNNAVIIPLHFEGWAHLSESRLQVETAFKNAAMEHRLRWLEPGRAIDFDSFGKNLG